MGWTTWHILEIFRGCICDHYPKFLVSFFLPSNRPRLPDKYWWHHQGYFFPIMRNVVLSMSELIYALNQWSAPLISWRSALFCVLHNHWFIYGILLSCSMWVSRFSSGSDGYVQWDVWFEWVTSGQQHGCRFLVLWTLTDVMFPNDLHGNPAVQMYYSSTCCWAAGALC